MNRSKFASGEWIRATLCERMWGWPEGTIFKSHNGDIVYELSLREIFKGDEFIRSEWHLQDTDEPAHSIHGTTKLNHLIDSGRIRVASE